MILLGPALTAGDDATLTASDAERPEPRPPEPRPVAIRPSPSAPAIERHSYRSPRGTRIVGGFGTIALGAVLAAGLLVALDRFDRPRAVSTPLVVIALPAASRPKPEAKPIEKQPPVEQPRSAPQPRDTPPILRTIVPLPSPQVAAATPQRVAVDPVPQTIAAPPAPATPAPAPQPAASHGPDRWEGRVLARLERFRRYPSDAQHAHVEGTATIRFRIDRDGHVLSSSIERSSGSAALDAAAMDTLRRADPLPKIPADRPDEIELVVPVEFSIKG